MHTTFRADYSTGGAGFLSFEMWWRYSQECQKLTSLKGSPGPSRAELLILRDVQIQRRSLWLIPRLFLFFFLSEGSMCENISKLFLLTAPTKSWKTHALENGRLLNRATLGYADKLQEQTNYLFEVQDLQGSKKITWPVIVILERRLGKELMHRL